jgi:chemotaxis protein CheC
MKKTDAIDLALTSRAMDAIREIGLIGAGHAATALSRLTGARVDMTVPEVEVRPIAGLPPIFASLEDPALGVLLPYGGDFDGHFLLLFPDEGVRALEEFLLRDPEGATPSMRESAIAETGSILAGSFLTMLSRMTGHILIPTPPLLVKDMAGAILDEVLSEVGTRSDRVLTLDFTLRTREGKPLARAVLIPDPTGLRLLLEAAERLYARR